MEESLYHGHFSHRKCHSYTPGGQVASGQVCACVRRPSWRVVSRSPCTAWGRQLCRVFCEASRVFPFLAAFWNTQYAEVVVAIVPYSTRQAGPGSLWSLVSLPSVSETLKKCTDVTACRLWSRGHSGNFSLLSPNTVQQCTLLL